MERYFTEMKILISLIREVNLKNIKLIILKILNFFIRGDFLKIINSRIYDN